MYLKDDSLVVTLGSLVFRSHLLDNASPQFALDETAITGWFDGVNVKRTATPYPHGFGDFAEPVYPASRLISLTGGVKVSSVSELHTLRDQLVGELGSGDTKDFSVTNLDGTRYSSVSLANTPLWTQLYDKGASWKLDLYAADPRQYGPVQNIQLSDNLALGGIDLPITYPIDFGVAIAQQFQYLSNAGNSEAWPVFTVNGDFYSGFTLTDNLGKFVSYNGPVFSSAPVTIDMKAGTATQNGSDRSQFLQKRDWISVPAGATIQPSFTPAQNGSGWCDILFRNTWI